MGKLISGKELASGRKYYDCFITLVVPYKASGSINCKRIGDSELEVFENLLKDYKEHFPNQEAILHEISVSDATRWNFDPDFQRKYEEEFEPKGWQFFKDAIEK